MAFDNEQITDDVLLNAVRKRLLQELLREQQSPNIDIQNIVGGRGDSPAGIPPGVFEGMRSPEPQEPQDYGVDITRADVWADPQNPGQLLPMGVKPPPMDGSDEYPDPIGWQKIVRRFRTPRGQEIERKKKT